MKLPETWIQARLGDVLTRVDARIDPQTSDSASHFYVGLEHIESHTGRLLRDADDVTESSEILSIKTAFTKDDILYGKLRPNLNKVYLAEQDGICSTDIWALRTTDQLLPEFALQYLRSPAIHVRAAQLAAGANLPRISANAFDRLSVRLPTLPEQQRIVDVLQQADSVFLTQQLRNQQLDLMIKAALDRIVFAIDETDWKPIGEMVETRYGSSVSADASVESGTPILRIPNIIGGEVNTADMKYVNLPKAELETLKLTDTDVLIVRSNGNPDYVGRSAPITKDIVHKEVVYASYLIRLRTDTNLLLPEYLSAFLNSAFGRAAMRNAIRTTAGQSNLSGGNLNKVRLPVPALSEQLNFKNFWLEVHSIRKLINASSMTASELINELKLQALSGDLTENWRKANKEEIATAAAARDALLRERGVKLKTAIPEPSVPETKAIESLSPVRQWVVGELSGFQRQLLEAFLAYPDQPLIVEDENAFIRFCDSDEVTERLQDFGTALNNRIRRALSQLAALGLIVQVTLPKDNEETGEREYLKAFRPLRETDFSKLSDIKSFKRALKLQSEEQYHFLVHLDYETSESAGAGGMFQVISIENDEGKDFTHLVDQGIHYSSLDELKAAIASAIKVSSHQIELKEE